MFIKYLKDSLEDFKDLIANEIEDVLNIDDGTGYKNENGGDKANGIERRKTMVMNNVPKSKNNEKGMLKHHKDVVKQPSTRSKSKDRKSSTGGNNPVAMKQIHPAHENFNMVFNIMCGIKKSVDSTLDIPLLNATDKDFNLKC